MLLSITNFLNLALLVSNINSSIVNNSPNPPPSFGISTTNIKIDPDISLVKRDGNKEILNVEKIKSRLVYMSKNLDTNYINKDAILNSVVQGLSNDITSRELDVLIAETAAYMSTEHPDYAKLAANIAISELHRSKF